MTAEEWRPIADAPGYYVSSEGRVASMARGRVRVLKPWLNANGYWYVNVGGRSGRKRPIHRFVAEAFHGPLSPDQVVRHLDGAKQHNAAANLSPGTPSENNYDAVRHGTHGMANRTACPRGHEYTAENTRLYHGRRFCKTCIRNRVVEARRQRGQLLIVGTDPLKPCPKGHVYTPENTYVYRNKRHCRTCSRARSREWAINAALRAAGIQAA